jgi:hypothetical protein
LCGCLRNFKRNDKLEKIWVRFSAWDFFLHIFFIHFIKFSSADDPGVIDKKNEREFDEMNKKKYERKKSPWRESNPGIIIYFQIS